MVLTGEPGHGVFLDRADAGRRLAGLLAEYRGREGLVVLGLPRGGVPVAFEVARALDAPLDIFVVRKLGVPDHPELAMGAIASGGVRVVNERVLEDLALPKSTLDAVTAAEQKELERQESALRGDGAGEAEDLAGRPVIVVDDGLATGASMRAAVQALRARDVAEIIAAVPVAAQVTCEMLSREVDRMVCAVTPMPFRSVGEWYANFAQTTDGEVRALLAAARRRGGGPGGGEQTGERQPG